jgi:acid phosphatase (class A)
MNKIQVFAKKHYSTVQRFFVLFLLFSSSFVTLFAQNSQTMSIVYKSLSPDFDHYQQFAQLSTAPQNVVTDTVRFPLTDFRRMSYLKMRTVYIDVPVSTFKLRNYPANTSAQTQAELAFLLELQQKRTPEMMAQTEAMSEVYYDPYMVNPTNEDYPRNQKSVFFIGRNLGDWYNTQNLPVTTKVLQNVIQDATFYFFSLKSEYARPRPYQLSKDIKNPEAPGHSSFPSGHSSASYVNALVLSAIFPELRQRFLGNAYDMAFSREIRGVHYPSDSKMGKDFAEQFVSILLKNKQFKADFEKMKVELKNAKK